MLKRAVELEAVEKEVAAVPRMLDIDGLPPSRILQLALVAGIGLMVTLQSRSRWRQATTSEPPARAGGSLPRWENRV